MPATSVAPSADRLAALPELDALHGLIDEGAPLLQSRVACEVQVSGHKLPVHVLTLGPDDPQVPAVGFFGGVHGLERIGAQVVLAYLRSLVMRLKWDSTLHSRLEHLRLVFMPLVNPGGLYLGTRANPAGVDLMRNAPVDSEEPVPWLIGGQRISAALPWYRGAPGVPMQSESRALCSVVESELLSRPFSLAVDCHSGFGFSDRIWFPYAHCRRPIEHLAEMHALAAIFDQTYAQHRYVFEPQSRQYLAHGDLWDHLYLRACGEPDRVFLPLTLELGSWLWVKKNPRQIFSRQGIFNPLIAHREQRVLRQHLTWLDFVARAAASHARWRPAPSSTADHREQGLTRWYRG